MISQSQLEGSLSYFREREKHQSGLARILGNSPAIVETKQRIRLLLAAERSADSKGLQPGPPVLILGETGTGKELIARALHFDGPRANQPFISVNCATLPEQLVESELFGHERGAFTGASDKKIGLFQAAEGGTLFLDEIGELPLPQQAKLLKAIEDKMIRPVGSVRDRPINVRFIAATNAALEEQSRQAEFRSDLLYRLNTFVIDVPPLRKRGDDIIMLAENFVVEFQRRYVRSRLSLTPDARTALLKHVWPGNVRELRNVIEQACLMCARDAIEESDLNLREVPSLVREAPAALHCRPDQSGRRRAIPHHRCAAAAWRQRHAGCTQARRLPRYIAIPNGKARIAKEPLSLGQAAARSPTRTRRWRPALRRNHSAGSPACATRRRSAAPGRRPGSSEPAWAAG